MGSVGRLQLLMKRMRKKCVGWFTLLVCAGMRTAKWETLTSTRRSPRCRRRSCVWSGPRSIPANGGSPHVSHLSWKARRQAESECLGRADLRPKSEGRGSSRAHYVWSRYVLTPSPLDSLSSVPQSGYASLCSLNPRLSYTCLKSVRCFSLGITAAGYHPGDEKGCRHRCFSSHINTQPSGVQTGLSPGLFPLVALLLIPSANHLMYRFSLCVYQESIITHGIWIPMWQISDGFTCTLDVCLIQCVVKALSSLIFF